MKGAAPFSLGRNRRTGVLLLHGFTSTPDSMRMFGTYLARAGLTVDCPLLPGHGTNWQDLARTPYTAWIESAERAYAGLQKRCRRVFVAGLSMGGGLAILLAENHPEIAGVIAVNNVMVFTDPRLLIVGLLKRLVPSSPAIASDLADPGQKELAYDRTPTAAVHELVKMTRRARAGLDRVTQPLLVFKSKHDHVVPRVSALYTMERAASKDRQLVWLERSFHVATMDLDREEIFRRSLEFVRKRT